MKLTEAITNCPLFYENYVGQDSIINSGYSLQEGQFENGAVQNLGLNVESILHRNNNRNLLLLHAISADIFYSFQFSIECFLDSWIAGQMEITLKWD